MWKSPHPGPPHHARAVSVSPAVVLLALILLGCGKPAFPKQLFTVESQGADYPIMLSRAPIAEPGRDISASSGTHFAQSSQSYTTSNVQVRVTTTERGESELSAAEKFSTKIGRSDRWAELQNATYIAKDFSTYASSSADRTLELQGKAHK
jgi:hypothetical protein